MPRSEYFGLYKSAGWCPPCRAFTPGLVEFYNRIKPTFPGFEVILESGDKTEEDMAAYMISYKMSWPALEFKKKARHPLSTKYHAGSGYPHLVLVDKSGKVLYTGRDLGAVENILKNGPPADLPPKAATKQGSASDDSSKKEDAIAAETGTTRRQS